MKRNRAKVNFFADAILAIAFLAEVVSGFVLWAVLPSGGYQGGRNVAYGQTFIISRSGWLSLHDWFALIMGIVVVVHLVLHWRWIYRMSRTLWREAFAQHPVVEESEECPIAARALS